MPDPPRRARDRAHRAMAEAERVGVEVVIVEHAPRPADDGVGVDVRHVVEAVRLDQLVAQLHDAGEVVEAERIGRAHRRDDARDPRAGRGEVVQHARQLVEAHLVVVGRRRP